MRPPTSLRPRAAPPSRLRCVDADSDGEDSADVEDVVFADLPTDDSSGEAADDQKNA